MEFPDLGEQCSLPTCKQLDFLPFKCNACSKMFCKFHRHCSDHSCPYAGMKDKVVPTCPLCSKPVALGPGDTPDGVVTRHIDNNCDSEAAFLRRQKRQDNKCSYKGCKGSKDSLRMTCDRCGLRYCLKHRHEMDHDCSAPRPPPPKPSSSPWPAAVAKASSRTLYENPPHRRPAVPTALHVHSLQQPGLSEDEAMKRAIELSLQSMGSEGSPKDGEEEDRRLQDESDEAIARALQEAEFSQQQGTPVTTSRDSSKQSCSVS